jgi:hypothetical protein
MAKLNFGKKCGCRAELCGIFCGGYEFLMINSGDPRTKYSSVRSGGQPISQDDAFNLRARAEAGSDRRQ